ncbi:MAG: S8 family serine peptidase, partial [Deltaproteobacteria bacterium]|nr:S8 family serine peptidase [Deltaproteobacteria bacterium]
MYQGFDHNPTLSCGDNFLPSSGYGPCTGTSMATPFLVGIAALVRSVNPLLSREDVYDILISTASQADNHTDELGYGFPDAEAAVKKALGLVNGETLKNRLTPFFSFFGRSSDPTNPANLPADTWFYTTVPTVASGLLLDYEDPFETAGPNEVSEYRAFPTFQPCDEPCDTAPKASIFVFTTSRVPFAGAPELVPLYRLRYDPDILRDCDINVDKVPERDFAYATSVDEVLDFNTAGYYLDGIEGFIFKSCEGQPGCTQPPDTLKVYRAYNPTRIDYAIFPEDELPGMQADGYTSGITVIGYAYPNVDTDGDTLIDGFEELIGTNPRFWDTDCDGLSDGHELTNYNQVQHQYGDPRDGPCWTPGVTIFADGFDSGDISRWSAAVP